MTFDFQSKSLLLTHVQDLILKIVPTSPDRAVEEGAAKKLKWLNKETKKYIGHDTLVKGDPNDPKISMITDLEHFGMVERVKDWSTVSSVAQKSGYELVTCGGEIVDKKCNQEGERYTEQHLANDVPAFIKQELGVIPGDKMQNPTQILNVIAAQVGEVNGKPVLTLMTVFQGHSPVDESKNDIMDKKQFKKYGYYFLRGK